MLIRKDYELCAKRLSMFRLPVNILLLLVLFCDLANSQSSERWQQRVEYDMDIKFDVSTHRFEGVQKLVYHNNSPDTLTRVFYHLYLNAFQPGSMMDVRSRTIPDPDPRVGDRISKLKPEEMGYQGIISLRQDGEPVSHETVETILEVQLAQPLLPGSSTTLDMIFESQVPVQIRRNGRDNAEGISYSMSQWYPKLCEYDYQGWHAHPYVSREYHGVWGDFDVKIEIAKEFIVAATGVLQNASEIGYGYSDNEIEHDGDKLTWHFKADNVIDFVWAADPDYTHTHKIMEDGTVLRFFYQESERNKDNWEALPGIIAKVWPHINSRYGQYPYPVYSFIQGGDSGMEYPMATLITGERSIGSLVGVSIHEVMHSWYQGVLATNESLYAWMDEGFTEYAETEIKNQLRKEGLIPGKYQENPYEGIYHGYRNLALSPLEEPLSTHADHFVTNQAYGIGTYTKGNVFLRQLEYIVGLDVFDRALLEYYNTWKFRHPNVNDFLRVFEKASGFELDWYKEYFINTTHRIDYSVSEVEPFGEGCRVILRKNGVMPMPIDVEVKYADGSSSFHTIPLQIMRGAKKMERDREFQVEADWPWTHPIYAFVLPVPRSELASVTIDPTERLADVNLRNNNLEISPE